jgi:hypothetical protein
VWQWQAGQLSAWKHFSEFMPKAMNVFDSRKVCVNFLVAANSTVAESGEKA